jgi:hypothetical protein
VGVDGEGVCLACADCLVRREVAGGDVTRAAEHTMGVNRCSQAGSAMGSRALLLSVCQAPYGNIRFRSASVQCASQLTPRLCLDKYTESAVLRGQARSTSATASMLGAFWMCSCF